MHATHSRGALVAAAVTIAAMALAGCGSLPTVAVPAAEPSGTGPLAQCSGTVTVASELPTSGGDYSVGGGTEKGIQLAVSQARADHLIGNCDIAYLPYNDATAAAGKHDPLQGALDIQEIAANPAVVGVVGPFNSGVAVKELPISNAAGLCQISPGNTDPGLTIPGSDPAIDTASLQPSGKVTYYRIISNDVVQAQVMAEFTYRSQGIKSVYTIDDQDTYGTDLANYFDQFYTGLGGTVVGRVSLPGNTRDFRPSLQTAKAADAKGVFFGGVSSNGAGLISAQMKQLGLDAAYLSGDGSVDIQYFIDGDISGKAYASSAPDATNLPSARAINELYVRTFSQDPVAYSAYGYDAMNILLEAIRQTILANHGTLPGDSTAFRAAVAAQVGRTDWQGAIGRTRFDQRGDTLNKAFTIYQAVGGNWVGGQTITTQG